MGHAVYYPRAIDEPRGVLPMGDVIYHSWAMWHTSHRQSKLRRAEHLHLLPLKRDYCTHILEQVPFNLQHDL